MRMLAFQCPQCGAPNDRPAGSEGRRCEYCGGALYLGTASTAEVAADPRSPDVRELDREWEDYRAQWLPRNPQGEYEVPVPEHCETGAWLTGIGGAITAFALTGLLGWGLGIVGMLTTVGVALVLKRQAEIGRVYARSLANYQRARRALLERGGGSPMP